MLDGLLVGKRFVSGELSRPRCRIQPSRRGFRICPVASPFAVTQDLVAGMDSEFDEHRPLGHAEHLGTNVDDAPAEFEPLIEGAAAANLYENHRDGLQTVLADVEQIILAEFGNPDVGRHNCVCITSGSVASSRFVSEE